MMADTFSFEDASKPVTKSKATTFSFEDAAAPAPKPAAKPVAAPKTKLGSFIDVNPGIGLLEGAANLASGLVAKPLGDIAGLAALGKEMIAPSGGDPRAFQQHVQQSLTYNPRTTAGQVVAEYNPVALLGKGIGAVAEGAGELVGGDAGGDTLRGAAGNVVKEAVSQAPGFIAPALKGRAAARLDKATKALEAEKVANAGRDAAIKEARDLGYKLPPSVAGVKGPLSSFFQGEVGSTKLDYGTSFKNQNVTNSLIKKELGLAADEPISVRALNEIRDKHGAAYEAVKKAVPELQVTPEFVKAIRNPDSKFAKAKAEFPEYFKNKEVEQLVKTLSRDKFSADAAIELQKKLRYDGYDNKKAFDNPSKKALGEAQLNAAKQIDALIDQNLAMKAPAGVKNFQSKLATNLAEARRRIAQTYAVEKALNDTTGNVSAPKLAKMWDKDQTLTGGLRDVAKTNKAFEKQTRDVDKLPATATEGISNLDVAKATGLAALGHGAIGSALTLGRMGLKPFLLSDFYQNRYVRPGTYQPGLMQTLPAQFTANRFTPLLSIPRPPQEER